MLVESKDNEVFVFSHPWFSVWQMCNLIVFEVYSVSSENSIFFKPGSIVFSPQSTETDSFLCAFMLTIGSTLTQKMSAR